MDLIRIVNAKDSKVSTQIRNHKFYSDMLVTINLKKMVAKSDSNQIINKPNGIYLLQLKNEICGLLINNFSY